MIKNTLTCLKNYMINTNYKKIDLFYKANNLFELLIDKLEILELANKIFKILGKISAQQDDRNILIIKNNDLIKKMISILNNQIEVKSQVVVI